MPDIDREMTHFVGDDCPGGHAANASDPYTVPTQRPDDPPAAAVEVERAVPSAPSTALTDILAAALLETVFVDDAAGVDEFMRAIPAPEREAMEMWPVMAAVLHRMGQMRDASLEVRSLSALGLVWVRLKHSVPPKRGSRYRYERIDGEGPTLLAALTALLDQLDPTR